MLYLAVIGDHDVDPGDAGPWEERLLVHPGLVLIESTASRSVVYHAVKAELPADAPLLVAPLADAPKMKGMAPGAVAWVRDRT